MLFIFIQSGSSFHFDEESIFENANPRGCTPLLLGEVMNYQRQPNFKEHSQKLPLKNLHSKTLSSKKQTHSNKTKSQIRMEDATPASMDAFPPASPATHWPSSHSTMSAQPSSPSSNPGHGNYGNNGSPYHASNIFQGQSHPVFKDTRNLESCEMDEDDDIPSNGHVLAAQDNEIEDGEDEEMAADEMDENNDAMDVSYYSNLENEDGIEPAVGDISNDQIDTQLAGDSCDIRMTSKRRYTPRKKQADFRVPTDIEKKYGDQLIGRRIRIYWDGDDAFYPGSVTSYDPETGLHKVLYENDATGDPYEENLAESKWELFDGAVNYTPKKAPAAAKLSYISMVVEAVAQLNDRKDGSSLQAIRKYVYNNYDVKKQQMASFNSLSLKAVNKAVAIGDLERVKTSHSFRLTQAAIKARREKELKALGLWMPKKEKHVEKYKPEKTVWLTRHI
jgi:hypothetical protein